MLKEREKDKLARVSSKLQTPELDKEKKTIKEGKIGGGRDGGGEGK